jgi:hypothetical protein
MELSEVHSQGIQQFMTAVFHVMLVVGVVDDSLEVAFIVANLHLMRKFIII